MKEVEGGLYEFCAAETNALIWVYVLLQNLTQPENDEAIKRLAKRAGVAREWGAAKAFTKKALDECSKLMCPEQARKFLRVLRIRSVLLVNKSPVLHKIDGMREISDSDLDKLLDWARMWFACDMCMKDDKAARKCELRKLLVGTMPPVEHGDVCCEYGVKAR